MAQYIKAKQVEAVPKKVNDIDGYEVTSGKTVAWQEAKAFEAGHVQIGKDSKKK